MDAWVDTAWFDRNSDAARNVGCCSSCGPNGEDVVILDDGDAYCLGCYEGACAKAAEAVVVWLWRLGTTESDRLEYLMAQTDMLLTECVDRLRDAVMPDEPGDPDEAQEWADFDPEC